MSAADEFARRVDLALPAELRPVVAQRLTRRRRPNLVAGCVAMVAWLLFAVWGLGATDGPVAIGLLGALAAVQLALAGAALVAQAGDLAHRGQDAPRAAHLPRPRPGDYLSPLELWLARGLAATAILVPLLLAATRPDRRGALLALAGTCLGAWALVELTLRAVARARPAATDVQSLAFDDALRADAARRLLGTAPILPLAAGLIVSRSGLWSAAAVLVALSGLGGVALSLLPERVAVRTPYRRRLWPAARA